MFFKRGLDIIISFISVVVMLPVLIIISILIKIDSKGPILFRQKRYGKNKKIFTILKFRTMYIDTPTNLSAFNIKNSHNYITRIGKILRDTSLDESLQLLNIIIGDMSLVGPRPVLLKEIDLIEERDLYGANNVRPGLTGLAQINGRNELNIQEKAKFDGQYVTKMSFLLDLKILFKTIPYVISKKGIVSTCSEPDNVENVDTILLNDESH